LHKVLPSDVVIDVYEKNSYSGGRAHDIEFAGERIEVGGTLIHSSNLVILELMQYAGVGETISGLNVDGKDETLGFWDGKKTYLVAKNSVVSLAQNLILKFGPFSAWNFRSSALKAVNSWKKVYGALQEGKSFAESADIADNLGLLHLAKTSLSDHLRHKRVSKTLVDDLAGAILQNMYLQNSSINAFAGLVGLAGAGIAGGHLFAVEGGNGALLGKVLDKISTERALSTYYNSNVTSVEQMENAAGVKLVVSGEVKEYDAVIIGTALELSGLDVVNGAEVVDVPRRTYQPVHVTLVLGDPRPEHFGLPSNTKVPSTVFVKAGQGVPYKSVGVTGKTADGRRIYKVFSDQQLATSVLEDIFTNVELTAQYHWDGAYPVLDPENPWPRVRLANNIYYTNGFETAAASIEVNAVAARNTAMLLAKELGVNKC
jgi:prenylcysteine oxidase/farnesylcysteine lyase